jgi:hypothetical protein
VGTASARDIAGFPHPLKLCEASAPLHLRSFTLAHPPLASPVGSPPATAHTGSDKPTSTGLGNVSSASAPTSASYDERLSSTVERSTGCGRRIIISHSIILVVRPVPFKLTDTDHSTAHCALPTSRSAERAIFRLDCFIDDLLGFLIHIGYVKMT